jgi:hypothetical protein
MPSRSGLSPASWPKGERDVAERDGIPDDDVTLSHLGYLAGDDIEQIESRRRCC